MARHAPIVTAPPPAAWGRAAAGALLLAAAAVAPAAAQTSPNAGVAAAGSDGGPYAFGLAVRNRYEGTLFCIQCAGGDDRSGAATALAVGAGYRFGRTGIEAWVIDWGNAPVAAGNSWFSTRTATDLHATALALGPSWIGRWGQHVEGHVAVGASYARLSSSASGSRSSWVPTLRLDAGWRLTPQLTLTGGYLLSTGVEDATGSHWSMSGVGLGLRWSMR